MKAAHVLFGLSPALDNASAAVSLSGAALHVAGLTAEVAGGTLTGSVDLDAAGTPQVAAQGTLAGATLSGPLLDGTLDVTGGKLGMTAALHASGFSPGALLATLDGTAHVTIANGVLGGVDFAAVVAALAVPDAAAAQAGVLKALQAGSTPFSALTADLAVRRGAVSVRQAAITAEPGQAAVTGLVDMPIDATDVVLTLTPKEAGAPKIGLRLIGPAEAPRRAPELAALAGWLAGR